MADRYPLVYNPSANQLQELQSGDSLDAGGTLVKNAVGYSTAGGTSSQFLKADGSIDSNTYLTSAGTVALAQGLTGSPSITVSNVTGANGTFSSNITAGGNISAVDGIFTGNVSIAGTITYDDVTHVDSQGIGTFREGINVVGHSELDRLRVSGVSTFQNNVHLADNVKINLGSSDDLQIYHNGTHSIIHDSGQGNLRILAGHLDIKTADGNDHMIVAHNGAAVTLYHNGSEKLATTGYGVTVAGIVSATQYYGDGSKLTGVAAAGSGGGALDITSCLFI